MLVLQLLVVLGMLRVPGILENVGGGGVRGESIVDCE